MDKEIALSDLNAICAVISDVDGGIPQRYVTPWRGEPGDAFAVVAPENVDQIRKLIEFAAQHGMRLLPQGERTGLVGASVPLESESDSVIILSMERFKNRLEYFPADNRVIVDAGYTISQVNDYLKPFGVHLPIDVSSDPMVGGAIATNIGGSRVLKFGDARKLLLGVEVVLADENRSIYSTIEKPRKDNSAPDFTGVFCGSFGQLGVITAGAFETYPLFKDSITAWLSLSKDVSLETLISKLHQQSGELMVACEFIGSSALSALREYRDLGSKLPFSKSNSDLIFVEWATSQEIFDLNEAVENILSSLSETSIVEDIAIVPPEITWQLRHLFSEALKEKGKLIGNDVSVQKDKITEFIQRVNAEISNVDPKLEIRPFGHLGDGGLHVNVIVEDEETVARWTQADSAKIRKLVGEIAVEMGGSFSAEHGLGSFNTQLYEELVPDEVKKIVTGFKQVCDPDNVLGHSGIKF